MKVHELGHLVLYVRNLDKSVEFYRDILGWDPIPSDLPFRAMAFTSGRTHHELLLIEVGENATPIPEGTRVGLYHFGLKIGDSDDDLREALKVLQENNVTFIGSADHNVTHSLYIQDPDGNEIELYIDVEDVDWKNHPEEFAKPPKPLVI